MYHTIFSRTINKQPKKEIIPFNIVVFLFVSVQFGHFSFCVKREKVHLYTQRMSGVVKMRKK